MRRCKGTFDIFFREHRTRKEEKEGAVQQMGQTRLESRCSNDENASNEDRKHTSGRVFVAMSK